MPSYENELQPLQGKYDVLPTSMVGMRIRVEAKQEILADKLTAFPATLVSHTRWRDLWDLQWLRTKRVEVNAGMVRNKVRDCGTDDFDDRRGSLSNSLAV